MGNTDLLRLNPIYIKEWQNFNVLLEERFSTHYTMLNLEKFEYPNNRIRYNAKNSLKDTLAEFETLPLGGTLRLWAAFHKDINKLPQILDASGTKYNNFFADILSFVQGAFMVPEEEVQISITGCMQRPGGLPLIPAVDAKTQDVNVEAPEVNGETKSKKIRQRGPKAYKSIIHQQRVDKFKEIKAKYPNKEIKVWKKKTEDELGLTWKTITRSFHEIGQDWTE